jgi:hypothetical protein
MIKATAKFLLPIGPNDSQCTNEKEEIVVKMVVLGCVDS